MADDELALAEEVHVAQDLRADDWMLGDQRVLLVRELARLEQDRVRHRHLADVVQQEAELDLRRLLEAEPDRAGQLHSVGGDAFRMLAGIRIARLDGVAERPHGRPIGAPQLLRAGALLLEHLAQIRRVAFELTLSGRGLLLRALKACTEERNRVLTGTGAQIVTIGARQRST